MTTIEDVFMADSSDRVVLLSEIIRSEGRIIWKKTPVWHDTDFVLQWFGYSITSYKTFLQKALKTTEPDLEGGGLMRSLGGNITKEQHKNPVPVDQRVLGAGDVVSSLLAGKRNQKALSPAERQEKMDEILRTHCEKGGITLTQLQSGCRAMPIPCIRRQVANALVRELGIPYPDIARKLGVSHVAVLK